MSSTIRKAINRSWFEPSANMTGPNPKNVTPKNRTKKTTYMNHLIVQILLQCSLSDLQESDTN